MPFPTAILDRARHGGQWFLTLATLMFVGEILGYVGCLLTGQQPPQVVALAMMAAVALLVGAVATVLLTWLVLDPCRRLARDVVLAHGQAAARQELELALASRIEQQKRLRHDIRGALSPILLTADRLLNHADPAVKRSGDIMVQTVERAITLLADPMEPPVNPPDDP